MGAVTFSIDTNLIHAILEEIPVDTFVETGTFKGETVAEVKSLFKNIYSIELSNELYKAAKSNFTETHVNILNGQSAEMLKALMPKLEGQSIIFWLDAHWCIAENTAGETSQCPLLDELEAIQSLNSKSTIIIDDARLFLAPPLKPHQISDWPKFSDVIDKLTLLSSHHKIRILNDCIVYFPESLEKTIDTYAYSHGIDWLRVMDKSRDYDKLLQQLIEKEEYINELTQLYQEKYTPPSPKKKNFIEKLTSLFDK